MRTKAQTHIVQGFRRFFVLLLLCACLFPSLTYASCTEADKYTGQDLQKKWTSPAPTDQVWSANVAQACVNVMKTSIGIGPYIDQVWPSDLRRLARAIACHENGAKASSSNIRKDGTVNTDRATCAFQIHWATGLADVGYATGVCTKDEYAVSQGKGITYKNNAQARFQKTSICGQKFAVAVDRDPLLCAKAGYEVFKWHYKAANPPSVNGALCGYSGGLPAKEYTKCGTCGMAIEFWAVADYMDGKTPNLIRVNTDINSEKVGQVTVKTSDNKTYVLYNCQDKSVTLAQGILKSIKSYQYAVITTADDVYKSTLKAQAKSTETGYRGKVKDKYCIEGISKFFNLIQSLLSGIDGIINLIKSMIQSLLNQVCSAIASSINSLLASICLPLPDLKFGLSFGGTTKSCSGMSLAKLISVQSGSVDLDKYFPGSTSQQQQDSSTDNLYPVNGLVTPSNGGVSISAGGWFKRALSNSKSTTIFKY